MKNLKTILYTVNIAKETLLQVNFQKLILFNLMFKIEDIAETHIPKCKNIFNRPKPPKKIKNYQKEKLTDTTNNNDLITNSQLKKSLNGKKMDMKKYATQYKSYF